MPTDAAADRSFDAPLRLAAAGVGLGVLAGTLAEAAVALAIRLLARPDTATRFPLLLILALFSGVLLAAAITWALLGPIGSTYRRGALALVAAFATTVTMLICVPAERLFGRAGLVGVIGVSAAGVIVLSARVRRLRAGT